MSCTYFVLFDSVVMGKFGSVNLHPAMRPCRWSLPVWLPTSLIPASWYVITLSVVLFTLYSGAYKSIKLINNSHQNLPHRDEIQKGVCIGVYAYFAVRSAESRSEHQMWNKLHHFLILLIVAKLLKRSTSPRHSAEHSVKVNVVYSN